MPMSTRTLLVAGTLALGLAGVAVWSLGRGSDDLAEVVLGRDAEPIDPLDEAIRERDERRASARNLGNMQRRDQDAASREPPASGEPGGDVDRSAAEQGFEHIMTRVEVTGDRGKRLTRAEWDELYRTANDAFAALSMHLDANDPSDRDQLEQAHGRLVEALDRVRVRGNKKLVD